LTLPTPEMPSPSQTRHVSLPLFTITMGYHSPPRIHNLLHPV